MTDLLAPARRQLVDRRNRGGGSVLSGPLRPTYATLHGDLG